MEAEQKAWLAAHNRKVGALPIKDSADRRRLETELRAKRRDHKMRLEEHNKTYAARMDNPATAKRRKAEAVNSVLKTLDKNKAALEKERKAWTAAHNKKIVALGKDDSPERRSLETIQDDKIAEFDRRKLTLINTARTTIENSTSTTPVAVPAAAPAVAPAVAPVVTPAKSKAKAAQSAAARAAAKERRGGSYKARV
jgi:hypothetical protein